jgi:hypothetical protein
MAQHDFTVIFSGHTVQLDLLKSILQGSVKSIMDGQGRAHKARRCLENYFRDLSKRCDQNDDCLKWRLSKRSISLGVIIEMGQPDCNP